MSVGYLKRAIEDGDTDKVARFVRLHFGDGDEELGRTEIDKSWVEAVKLLIDAPETDRAFIHETLKRDPATLAALYFNLHFHFVERSGEWIHDGVL